MLTLSGLRHPFAAAIASPLLVLFFALMPLVPMCRPWAPLMAPLIGAVPAPGSERDLVLRVRADGMLMVGPTAVPAEQPCDELRSAFERAPDRPVVVQIDRRSPFRATREIVTALHHLGVARFTLHSGEDARPPADGRN